MTLMSLFDGSGGFSLGAILTGIDPVGASEVEPFPIRVTTKRLPSVKHYGDVNKIDGSKIPPVDIITAGFCCQDLSVAGKRAGLRGERSGLFYQIPRIIKEMQAATDNEYPKFAVLENVPGMYSSAGGADFREVLNELIHIKDKTLSVPMPEKGKWGASGEIVGDGFSIGWRTLDAQFWGVAQRRRRCYIVVDFAGERAGEILFDESRLRGNPPAGGFPWQATAGNSAAGFGSPVRVLNDQGGSLMDYSEDVTGTLRAQEHGHQPIVFEPGAASRVGSHLWQGEATGALRADMGDNQLAVVYDARGNGNGEIVNTITGDHSNRVTDYTALAVEPKTLKIRSGCEGGGKGALVQNNRSATLSTSNDQTVFVPKPAHSKTYDVRQTSDGTANARCHAYESGVSRALDCGCGMPGSNHGGIAVVEESVPKASGNSVPMAPTAFGIGAYNSNGMKSANPHCGIYEADTARTLDTSVPDPNKNAGGMAIVALDNKSTKPGSTNGGRVVVFDGKQVTSKQNRSNPQPGAPCHTLPSSGADGAIICLEGNGSRPSHQGSGVSESGVSFSLNTVEQHGVAYVMTAGCFTQVCEEQSPTLQARDYKDAPVVNESQYIVRRLTPTECAMLQGFPPDWCAGLETPEPTEDDIAFWSEVWETHRIIKGTSSKPKTRNQIVKWLQAPHSDAAEYKMWGNGVALPCVVFVLGGIVSSTQG